MKTVIRLLFCLFCLFSVSCLDEPDMSGVKNAKAPTVTTSSPTEIEYYEALLNGSVESQNGYDVLFRGFIVSKYSNMTNGDTCVASLDSGVGSYTFRVEGLNSATQYYVKAFARNREGISTGEVFDFKTRNDRPAVETDPYPRDVLDGSAVFSGLIISLGAAPIEKCGICWSLTSSEPDVLTDSVSYSSDLEGTFDVFLEKMKGSHEYYYRAFAQNQHGTGYGEVMKFSTPLIWEPETTFPGIKRSYPATFTIGHNFHVIGGDRGTESLNDNWEYSITQNDWQEKDKFQGPVRNFATTFVIGNNGYVGLGTPGGGSMLSDFYYYKQGSNEWFSIQTSFDGVGRAEAAGFSLNKQGYVVGGRILEVSPDGSRKYIVIEEVRRYDEHLQEWKEMNPFPFPITEAIGFTTQDQAFVGFGTIGRLNGEKNNKIWKYNVELDSWSEFAAVPADLMVSNGITGVTVIETTCYVIDGNNQIWSLDLNTAQWMKKSIMPSKFKTPQVMFSYDHDVYVGLNERSDIFYKYRPYWDN